MNLTIAITTSPRYLATLKICIKSIRKAGWKEKIYIFAEPGNYELDKPGKYELIIHSKKKGALNNYDYILRWFVKRGGKDNDWLLISQDDFIFYNKFLKIIKDVPNKKLFGYLNVLTVAEHPQIKEIIKKEGWNQSYIGVEAWGAGYIMQKKTIENILNNDYYKEHKKNKTEKKEKHGKMIDGAISQCCKLMDLSMWVHNPSLVQHIGNYVSSLNHKGLLTGLRFDKWK